MKAAEYAALDALDLAALIASRDVTPEEVRAVALKAFEALNPSLNALVEHWDDEPLPPSGPLRGVPFLIRTWAWPWRGAATSWAAAWPRAWSPRSIRS